MSIRPIDKTSIHRITSGQVVIDLQTAVKELVENSLDAGATSIEVRFKQYGLASVEVIDNGSGIPEDNYEALALKHHTSKLSSFSDLTTVTTFGFRGEALSSLCALCESVTVVTATQPPMGVSLEMESSGKVGRRGKVARQRGTTITLTDLFSTLPVRRKEFERNAKREFGKALTLLNAYALGPCSSLNGVRLTVSNQAQDKGQKTVQIRTSGTPSLRDSVSALWGSKALDNIVDLNLSFSIERDKLSIRRASSNSGSNSESQRPIQAYIRGLISKFAVGCGRAGTDRQFFYVNGRPCHLSKLQKAFNEVYRSFNATQSPFMVADLILPTDACDINVSPDKRSILLHHEGNLILSLRAALETAFEAGRAKYDLEGGGTKTQTQLKQSTLSLLLSAETVESTRAHGNNRIAGFGDDRDRARTVEGEGDVEMPPPPSPPPAQVRAQQRREEFNPDSKLEPKPTVLRAPIRAKHDGESPFLAPVVPAPEPAPEPNPSDLSTDAEKAVESSSLPSDTGLSADADVVEEREAVINDVVVCLDTSSIMDGMWPSQRHVQVQAVREPFIPVDEIGDSDDNKDEGIQRGKKRRSEPRSLSPDLHRGSSVCDSHPRKKKLRLEPVAGVPEVEVFVPATTVKTSVQHSKATSARRNLRAVLAGFSSAGSQRRVSDEGFLGEDQDEDELDEDEDEVEVDGSPSRLSEYKVEEGSAHEQGSDEVGAGKDADGDFSRATHESLGSKANGKSAIEEDAPMLVDSDVRNTQLGSDEDASKADDDEIQLIQEDSDARTPTTSKSGNVIDLTNDDMLFDTSELSLVSALDSHQTSLSSTLDENDEAIPRPEVIRTAYADGDSDVSLRLNVCKIAKSWGRFADEMRRSSSSTAVGADAVPPDEGITDDEDAATEALARTIRKEDFGAMEIVGQFNLGFIIARRRMDDTDDLFIVDQHAADEKYNFETLQQTTRIRSQKLFRPQPLELTAGDELLALENIEVLRQNGFEVELQNATTANQGGDPSGNAHLALTAQPISKGTVFDMKDLEELIHLMHDRPAGEMVRCSKARAMFASRACRKSVMVGMPLNRQQMTTVVRHMGTMDQPWNCPHGRPTMRHVSDIAVFGARTRAVDWGSFA